MRLHTWHFVLSTLYIVLGTLYNSLPKILYPHALPEGVKSKRSRLIGPHKVHIQIRGNHISHSQQLKRSINY